MRWIDKNGKLKVNALAVASEPEIFWTGDNAEEIISKIQIPEKLGRLTTPRDKNLNGRALDNKYLNPIGLTRENSWVCDLIPQSRLNQNKISTRPARPMRLWKSRTLMRSIP